MKQLLKVALLLLFSQSALAWELPVFPKPRPETVPQIPSPYPRCPDRLDQTEETVLFSCAEFEFWHGFSDGRKTVRKEVEKKLGDILWITRNSQSSQARGRVYALRGYLRLALALENGQFLHLLGTMEGDFKQAKKWDVDNKIYDTFLDTIVIAKSAVFGDWDKAVEAADSAFVILAEQPVNILALSGTTIGFPLSTDIPQKTIATLDAFECPHAIDFCKGNTQHAPFARPGLHFHFAEAYARMNQREKAQEHLLLAKASPGFAEWPYKHLVEKPLADLDSYMDYWSGFGPEESLVNKVYANQNFGCVMCHGR